jgi:hypothetical protein
VGLLGGGCPESADELPPRGDSGTTKGTWHDEQRTRPPMARWVFNWARQ